MKILATDTKSANSSRMSTPKLTSPDFLTVKPQHSNEINMFELYPAAISKTSDWNSKFRSDLMLNSYEDSQAENKILNAESEGAIRHRN
jgi:hypothetical protein